MKKADALKIRDEIQSLCKKYGLWISVEHVCQPNLKMIKIKEISIKITEK